MFSGGWWKHTFKRKCVVLTLNADNSINEEALSSEAPIRCAENCDTESIIDGCGLERAFDSAKQYLSHQYQDVRAVMISNEDLE